jgi:hypothetical protein
MTSPLSLTMPSNVLHEQPAPPDVPEEPESEDEGEDPEEI